MVPVSWLLPTQGKWPGNGCFAERNYTGFGGKEKKINARMHKQYRAKEARVRRL